MIALDVLVSAPEGGVVALPEICIAYFKKSITRELAAGLRSANAEMLRRHPTGYVSLSLSHAAEMDVRAYGDTTLRTELMDVVRRQRETNVQHVIVVEGEGFGSAALRGAATAMVMLDRSARPARIVGTLDDAMRILERGCTSYRALPHPSVVLETALALRARYDVARAP